MESLFSGSILKDAEKASKIILRINYLTFSGNNIYII